MTQFWYGLLGLIMAGYFTLAGTDYGVGMQLPALRTGRRSALNALGPFFLANQVWVVAAVGVLAGAFPAVEGELLAAQYPLLIPIVLGLATIVVGVMLRSRRLGAREDRPVSLDRVIAVASAVIAVGWGMVLGNLLAGLPVAADGSVTGYRGLFGWFPALVGLATAALFGYHGAVFLAWRGGDRAASTARAARWWPVAAGVVVVTLAVAALIGRIHQHVGPKAPQAAGLAVAMVAALVLSRLNLRRPLLSWLFSGVAAALPALVVGLAIYPEVLISTIDPAASLTVTDGVAGADTLRLLNSVALPWLVVVVLVQAAAWMLFGRASKGPHDPRAVQYW